MNELEHVSMCVGVWVFSAATWGDCVAKVARPWEDGRGTPGLGKEDPEPFLHRVNQAGF